MGRRAAGSVQAAGAGRTRGRRQTVGAARRPSAWRAVAPRPAPAAGGPGWSRILSSMRRQCVLGAGASTVNGGRDSIRGDHPQARGDHRRDRRPDRRPLAPGGLSPVPRRGRGRLGRAAAGGWPPAGTGWVISLNHFGAGSPVRRCKPRMPRCNRCCCCGSGRSRQPQDGPTVTADPWDGIADAAMLGDAMAPR